MKSGIYIAYRHQDRFSRFCTTRGHLQTILLITSYDDCNELLFHGLRSRFHLNHCVWSVITAHNFTQAKREESILGDVQ